MAMRTLLTHLFFPRGLFTVFAQRTKRKRDFVVYFICERSHDFSFVIVYLILNSSSVDDFHCQKQTGF